MSHGRGKFYMTHTFATYNRTRNLHTTLLANNPLVADTTILATVTLKVFIWTENLFIKKTVTFTSLCSVIDSLWFRHFAKRPLFDTFRRSQVDGKGVKIIW